MLRSWLPGVGSNHTSRLLSRTPFRFGSTINWRGWGLRWGRRWRRDDDYGHGDCQDKRGNLIFFLPSYFSFSVPVPFLPVKPSQTQFPLFLLAIQWLPPPCQCHRPGWYCPTAPCHHPTAPAILLLPWLSASVSKLLSFGALPLTNCSFSGAPGTRHQKYQQPEVHCLL